MLDGFLKTSYMLNRKAESGIVSFACVDLHFFDIKSVKELKGTLFQKLLSKFQLLIDQ